MHTVSIDSNNLNFIDNINSSTLFEKKINCKADQIYPVSILVYHHISSTLNDSLNITEEQFEQQLQEIIKQNIKVISFTELYDIFNCKKSLDSKAVILTFDDGYIDNYQNAFRILKKFKLKGSFAIIPSLVGKIENGERKFMNWKEIIELSENGMEILSHSLTHPILTKLSSLQIDFELSESKKILESKLSKKIDTFVFPYGNYSNEMQKNLKNSNYLGGRIYSQSTKMSANFVYFLPAKKVYKDISISAFRKLL